MENVHIGTMYKKNSNSTSTKLAIALIAATSHIHALRLMFLQLLTAKQTKNMVTTAKI